MELRRRALLLEELGRLEARKDMDDAREQFWAFSIVAAVTAVLLSARLLLQASSHFINDLYLLACNHWCFLDLSLSDRLRSFVPVRDPEARTQKSTDLVQFRTKHDTNILLADGPDLLPAYY